ncbi:MAG: putative Ig domain-containing protein [Planctomycetaceae bacterium]|nr:putative Ig domain-containing protein [Planctomycetaceae bacterium]
MAYSTIRSWFATGMLLIVAVLFAFPAWAQQQGDGHIQVTPGRLPNAREGKNYFEALSFNVVDLPEGVTFEGFAKIAFSFSVVVDPLPTDGDVGIDPSLIGLVCAADANGMGSISGKPRDGTGSVFGQGSTTYILFVHVKYFQSDKNDQVYLSAVIELVIEAATTSATSSSLDAAVEGESATISDIPYVIVPLKVLTSADKLVADGASGLPKGLTLNSDGTISGAPEPGSAQSLPYEVKIWYHVVQDSPYSYWYFPSLTLSLYVVAPIGLGSADVPQISEGVSYDPIALEINGGTAPYTFDKVTGLPPGMSISAEGVLSGTPFCGAAEHGAYNVTFEVTDSTNPNSISKAFEFTLHVSGPMLVIDTALLPNAIEGVSYDTPLEISGVIASISISATGLPAGLHVAKLDGRWGIFGTPQLGTSGGYAAAVTVTETSKLESGASASHTVTKTLPLNVEGSGSDTNGLKVLNNFLPVAQVGEKYTPTLLRASGGSEPYVFSASGLPEGLTLSGTGASIITGKPDDESAGDYAVIIAVSDSSGTTASVALALNVAPAISDPIDSPGPSLTGIGGQLMGSAASSCSLDALSANAWWLFVLALVFAFARRRAC